VAWWIPVVRPEELAPAELANLDERFRTEIFPVLTPLAIDPGHPFPHLRNKMINLGIMFSREYEGQESGFGVIQVPGGRGVQVARIYGGPAREAKLAVGDIMDMASYPVIDVENLLVTNLGVIID
jgi:polyphosphate kinase